MDAQPDTDLGVDGQDPAQDGTAGVEAVGLTAQTPTGPEAPVVPAPPARRFAGATSLQDFFRVLGSTLVASRPRVPSGREIDVLAGPQAARENVKQALKDLRDLQAAKDQRPVYRYLGVLAPAAFAAVVVLVFMALPRTPEQLPPALIGSWHTSAAKYQDRTLYLTVDEIGFGQGSRGGVARYPITYVASARDAGGVLEYVVEYDNEGVTHRYTFIHQPVANTIKLTNQPQVVWQKIGD